MRLPTDQDLVEALMESPWEKALREAEEANALSIDITFDDEDEDDGIPIHFEGPLDEVNVDLEVDAMFARVRADGGDTIERVVLRYVESLQK